MGSEIGRKQSFMSTARRRLIIFFFLLLLLLMALLNHPTAEALFESGQNDILEQTENSSDMEENKESKESGLIVIPVIVVPEQEEYTDSESTQEDCKEQPWAEKKLNEFYDDEEKKVPEEHTEDEIGTESEKDASLAAAPALTTTKSTSGTVANSSYDADCVSVSLSCPDESVSSVTIAILDENENHIFETSLNESNAWSAVFYPDTHSTYSILVIEVLDQAGLNISSLYDKVITADDTVVSSTPSQHRFIKKSNLENGIYVFQVGSEDDFVLLSSDSVRMRAKSNNFYYYPLIPISVSPDNSGNASRWSVNSYGSAFSIASMNTEAQSVGFLSAGLISNRPSYLAIENADAYSFYTDGIFSSYPDGGSLCWLAFSDGSFYASQDAGTSTQIIPWRLENVSYRITEYPFSVNLLAIPQTTAITVRLNIVGNIADRTLSFPFSTTDGNPTAFSLRHQGEQVIEEVSLGSDFILQFDSKSYKVSADAGILSDGALTLNQLTEGTVINLVFSKDGNIETGLYLDNRPIFLLLFFSNLMVLLQLGFNQFRKHK